jgi:hypothetical protein
MDDARLTKIEALLRKAEDPAATEAEAEAFMAKAQELMTKWSIDEAMLAKAGETAQTIENFGFRVQGPYLVAKQRLCHAVAQANGCRMYYSPGYRTWFTCYLVGFSEDVQKTRLLIESIIRQGDTRLPATPPGYNGTRFRNSYWFGYASEIGTRLREVMKATVREAEAQVPGTALVLVDRKQQVDDWMDANLQLRSGGSTRTNTYGAGVSAGREAARQTDLGQTRVGGTRGALGA